MMEDSRSRRYLIHPTAECQSPSNDSPVRQARHGRSHECLTRACTERGHRLLVRTKDADAEICLAYLHYGEQQHDATEEHHQRKKLERRFERGLVGSREVPVSAIRQI